MMHVKKHLNFMSLRENVSTRFKAIPDKRQASKVQISIHDALMSGFACMHFQDPSLLQFQTRLEDEKQQNNLRTLFSVDKIPKESQMREVIDGIESDYFKDIFKDCYLQLQRGKHLEQFQLFPGLYYFPIDGTQFYSSEEVKCDKCLTKEHKKGKTTYSHQVLQGGIAHPDQKQVIPFMPEQICNVDGKEKQDCEMNAAKRYVESLRKHHPQLGFIIGGDSLFSRQPLIENILSRGMHYIFTAKAEDHVYLMDWVEGYKELPQLTYTDIKGQKHCYEWINEVPLSGREDAIKVNFFRYRMISVTKDGEEKVVYKSSWVTDIVISKNNIITLVRGGRCRWKGENEIFNVMKNQGYYMEHSYGHGKNNLCFNFYLLTLLAFLFHQIFELTDLQYQGCRKKFGSKKHFWETIRAYIKIIIFNTWDGLLAFALNPVKYEVTLGCSP